MELNQSKTYLDLNIDKCFSIIYYHNNVYQYKIKWPEFRKYISDEEINEIAPYRLTSPGQ